jgi:prevent-host-death family protein
MEMSVREARAQFAHALAAAERGERVTITKNGKPIAEIGPPAAPPYKNPFTWEKAAEARKKLGIKLSPIPLDEEWRKRFDDPAWSREIFGVEYFPDDVPDER